MANKALATRQKMRIRIEPSQQTTKPRNPVALAAQQRAPGAAGAHAKGARSLRQAAKRALAKTALKPED